MGSAVSSGSAFERVAAAAAQHVLADRRLRRNLPGEGRLHLDRALPFLVAYRRPPRHLDAGTAELATAPSAYLVASGEARFHAGLSRVVQAVAGAARDSQGAFLLLELWTAEENGSASAPNVTVVAGRAGHAPTVDVLIAALRSLVLEPELGGELGVAERLAAVELRSDSGDGLAAPPGLPPLLDASVGGAFFRIGLEVAPFYRDGDTGQPYPRVLQALRRAMARVLQEAFFAFAQEETSLDPPHPRALARTSAERSALHVDRRLGEVYGAFDTLLLVTPLNSESEWEAFRSRRFREPPSFRYRPLPFDPEHLKRRLFHVPIERVEAPLLGFLFREKLEELDRQITLVRGLGTARFLHASAELYGTPDDDLVALAHQVLERLPPPDAVGEKEEYPERDEVDAERDRFVDADTFARLARREILRYRRQLPDFLATVAVRSGIAAGLMVSKDTLLVSEHLRVPRERVGALLSHEVGTHLVRHFNGAAQPLRIFASGLAGYEALEEGTAVLSEYLVGGLTLARMRVLAGRVLAVRSLVEGADFLETFTLLHRELGFRPRTAYVVALRVFRGGGLTKDAVYLKGLRDLLRHLREEGSLDPLLVGKVGLAHASVVQELVLTGVLRLPVVRPLFTSDLAAMERLGGCRRMDVLDVAEALRP